jgi:FdrA protein
MGFANQIRRGPIGLVAASGTGLQQVSARLHQMGSGISHALGTGGRDLTQRVNALTALQGIDLLSRDHQTNVIVLISKPPAPNVADKLVRAARLTGKPVVVNFIGYATPVRQVDNVHFAATFDETAKLAVQLAASAPQAKPTHELHTQRFAPDQRYLRGLFSGGTLAYEAQLILKDYLPAVYANAPLDKDFRLADSLVSQAHTIVDLGEDEFTVGRLHPMMDNDLRIRRLEVEASDPQVAVILLDVVLGYGAHPNPAGELAPAIARARSKAEESKRYLEVVAVITGTDEDPQDLDIQTAQLEGAGAVVFTSNDDAARYAGRLAGSLDPQAPQAGEKPMESVGLAVLHQPLAAINVGLESFAHSLAAQDAPVIQVDWRPPAGGNQKLMAILERMKNQ